MDKFSDNKNQKNTGAGAYQGGAGQKPVVKDDLLKDKNEKWKQQQGKINK